MDRTTRLLRDGLAGDASRFAGFVERVTPLLLAVAWRCLRGHRWPEPADVVQTVWLSCLPHLGRLLEGEGRLTPRVINYLSEAIRRRARDELLRVHHDPGSLDRDSGRIEPEARTVGIVTRVLAEERKSQVLEAIEALEEIDRDALTLLSIEQTPLADAALILGISPDAAKQRHKRARDRLRRQLPGSVFDELD